MVTIKLIVLSLAILGSQASFPDTPTGPPTRNTITAEEKFEGGVFEDVDTVIDTRNIAPEAYRLPTTTKPSHYDVLWTIDIERLTYSGTVSINLSATSAGVNEIVLHSDHSAIISVALTQGNVVIPTTYRTDPEPQFLIVSPTNNSSLTYNATSPVIYTLTISFGAELRDDMYGIYKSWFRNNATDAPRYMASTQFQATAARYAFPCYDEPSFKATFNITIRRPNTHRSWSCTRIQESRTVVVNYTDDVYHTTPVMSTYLLALIVAEYDSIEYRDNNVLMYEVIARPGAINADQGQYAFDVGQDLLTVMNDHTGLDFHTVHPHIKMTQAAIPDFSAGAMENWGLLTYREAYLMYDPEHTSSYFKQLIAYILSHEIAHMWLGNLVTCDWWDVLWLNEGFARYYQYFLTHWVEDYMGLETRFITEQIHTSLLTDSANNPQPLTSSGIGSPASVRSMFGTITYNKGAAVIRMTEHLLGFEIHRQGLQNYLVDRSFDIAQPIHLFEALQNVSLQYGAIAQYGDNFNFIDYYKSWTEQPGHPVLNVQVDHSTGRMTIYQRRFNINTGYSYTDTNYIVPITFATASNPDFTNTKPSHILTKSVTVIDRSSVGDEWVVFNKQQTGFYRVNYDDYTWDLIVLTLRGANRTLIHEYNRAQIVNDVFQFARSGLISYSRAFNILSFLEFETDYAPWVAATTGFAWIRNRLVGTPQWNSLNELVARWATRVMGELTYSPIANETFMRSYLRYQLAPVMCLMGVQACRTAATTQFNALRINGTEVPVDSRNWVYCNALRDGTTDDFNFLYQRFQNHNVYTEKIQIVWVLGCTPHQASLNTLLTAIVQDNYIIRPQDYTNAWSGAVSGNEGNTQIVFQYIQNNLNAVRNGFGSLTTPLSYVSARLRTAAEITAYENWVNQNQVLLGDEYSAILNGASASRQNIEWAAEVAGDMNNYFVNGGETVVTSTQATTVSTSPVTVAQPNLVEPSTPSLPERDAASTTFLSLILVTMALIANIVI